MENVQAAEAAVAKSRALDLGSLLQIASLGLMVVTLVTREAVQKWHVQLIKKENASIMKQADLDQKVMERFAD